MDGNDKILTTKKAAKPLRPSRYAVLLNCFEGDDLLLLTKRRRESHRCRVHVFARAGAHFVAVACA